MTQLNSREYQENAKKTMAKLPIRDWDEIHMVLGMVTEAGELADVYKKYIAYIKPIDYVNVKEELGDLLWYIANMCNILDLSLEDIFEINIAKLKARYGESFSEEKANTRDLLHERKILETS